MDCDLSKDTVKQELARKSSTWTACVLSDMEALNIGGVVAHTMNACIINEGGVDAIFCKILE